MRWILALLVASNILYFFWQNHLRPIPESPAAGRMLASTSVLPPVLLLGEKQRLVPPVAAEIKDSERSAAKTILLGGFVQQEVADELRQRLLSLGVDGRMVAKEVAAEEEYWVYMLPLSSRAATLRLLKELQARKIDGFLISQGELANGISLGIFQFENSAQAVLDRLELAGYQAQLKKISRQQSSYWFEVSVKGQRLLDDRTLQSLLKDFPDLQHLQE